MQQMVVSLDTASLSPWDRRRPASSRRVWTSNIQLTCPARAVSYTSRLGPTVAQPKRIQTPTPTIRALHGTRTN